MSKCLAVFFLFLPFLLCQLRTLSFWARVAWTGFFDDFNPDLRFNFCLTDFFFFAEASDTSFFCWSQHSWLCWIGNSWVLGIGNSWAIWIGKSQILWIGKKLISLDWKWFSWKKILQSCIHNIDLIDYLEIVSREGCVLVVEFYFFETIN